MALADASELLRAQNAFPHVQCQYLCYLQAVNNPPTGYRHHLISGDEAAPVAGLQRGSHNAGHKSSKEFHVSPVSSCPTYCRQILD